MSSIQQKAMKWDKLVKAIKDSKDDSDFDIWDFLGDELGLAPDGNEDSDSEFCEFCGDSGDILCYCEGCTKKGCEECVKTYIDSSFGDCKECCKKANFPEGNGWESECESESD